MKGKTVIGKLLRTLVPALLLAFAMSVAVYAEPAEPEEARVISGAITEEDTDRNITNPSEPPADPGVSNETGPEISDDEENTEPEEIPIADGFCQETLSDGRTVTVYYVNGAKVTGQLQIGGYWYMFLSETGEMVTGFYNHTTQTNPHGGAKTCYYDSNGRMVYGQYQIGGYWYMFRPDSGAMVTGFYNHTEQTNPHGGAKTCYYDSNGHMIYGQRQIGGYWYMFRPGSGAMVTGFYNHTAQTNPNGGAKTCYYDTNGRMVYGQLQIGNYWYMFRPGSGAMVTGFYNHTAQTNPSGGAKICYYDSNGRMVYGQRTIDGTPCVFDTQSGALNVRRTYPQACAVLDQVGWDLRAAYNWAASRGYDTEQGLGKTSRQFADETFRTNKGNCYGMAAVFYEMARVLGYDVHQMSGSVPYASGGMGPHSWVEITVNGTMYVCDPEFEESRGRNGYMIHYGQSGTFRYSDYTRMN